MLILLLYAIYQKVLGHSDIGNVWYSLKAAWAQFSWFIFSAICLLWILNVAFEAFKWQILIRQIERMTLMRSILAVCSGITFSLFTPNRVGEFGGRILFLQDGNRIKGVALTLIGSFSQIIANVLIGALGMIFFYKFFLKGNELIFYSLFFLLIIATTVLLILYFNADLLKNLVGRTPYLRRWARFLDPLKTLKANSLLAVLLFSMGRNLIFTFQQILVFYFLSLSMGWTEGFVLASSMFFAQTIIPTIALLELGVRGNLALYFFSFITERAELIISGTFLLWILNLLIPAVIGFLAMLPLNLVMRPKLKANKK